MIVPSELGRLVPGFRMGIIYGWPHNCSRDFLEEGILMVIPENLSRSSLKLDNGASTEIDESIRTADY